MFPGSNYEAFRQDGEECCGGRELGSVLNFEVLAVIMLRQKTEAVFYWDIYQSTRSYISQYHDLNFLQSSSYFTYHQVSG
jgi:hypothetical protein